MRLFFLYSAETTQHVLEPLKGAKKLWSAISITQDTRKALASLQANSNTEQLTVAASAVVSARYKQTGALDADMERLIQQMKQAMRVVDANWRGIGTIPGSGYALSPDYARWDARLRFPDYDRPECKRAGEMPAGYDCAQVVLSRKYPNQCRLYGEACTPLQPVGPCMVSDEGACRIWWSGGFRERIRD